MRRVTTSIVGLNECGAPMAAEDQSQSERRKGAYASRKEKRGIADRRLA